MRGNVWKTDGKNPQEYERRVRLLRYIARQLSLPDTFVLFHIDGDRPWSERHTSENVEKFDRLVRARLPQVVDRGRANSAKARSSARADGEAPPAMRLEHLILICPFRSIEAWVYQNVPVAMDICRREHRGAHAAELQAWGERREEIDELPTPEESICLAEGFNLELATRGFPTPCGLRREEVVRRECRPHVRVRSAAQRSRAYAQLDVAGVSLSPRRRRRASSDPIRTAARLPGP